MIFELGWEAIILKPFVTYRGHAKDSAVKSLFGLDLENVFTCNKCGTVMKRSMTSSANDLSYPELMQDR